MSELALWRRLDTPGHDAARLSRADDGWHLEGTAVFMHETGPANLYYAVDLDRNWTTLGGRISGFLSGDRINQIILRDHEGWTINGKKVEDLGHLVDLDLGFTPATNLQQLRRIRLQPGKAVDLPVAWIDAGASTLVELPQHYERRDERTYWYEAPSVGYTATLEMAENGFVSLYPHLWEMERHTLERR